MLKAISKVSLCFIFVFFCLILNTYASTKYVILTDAVNIRTGPGTTYGINILGNIGSTYYLKNENIVPDEPQNGKCDAGWYEIDYNGLSAYICSEYAKIDSYEIETNREPINACEVDLKNAGFPSSYWTKLCDLKTKYPNWQFNAVQTNIEWTTAVNKFTTCSDSLLSNPREDWKDKTCNYSEGSFVTVNQNGVAYYLDPRNFLTEKYIFQFEDNRYNPVLEANYSTLSKTIIENAAFYKYHFDQGTDLPTFIAQGGKETNTNPIHLASRMLQELGTNTRLQNLYQGTFYNYIKVNGVETLFDFRGFYNFYNIGVTGACVTSGPGATYCGLTLAQNEKYNWNSVYAAVSGGASVIHSNFIAQGQYTSYFERFNVVPTASKYMYVHYYMANLAAPSSEASTAYNAYKANNLLNSAFTFHIPVYINMSASIINSGNGAVGDNGSLSTPSTSNIASFILTAGYKLTNDFISGIQLGTTVEIMKGNIEALSGVNTVTITDLTGNVITTGLIGTGYKITIQNATETKTFSVIVKGDTSGDGVINAKDLLEVQKNILGIYNLNEHALKSADTSGDGIINAKDLLEVQKSILGTYTITQ